MHMSECTIRVLDVFWFNTRYPWSRSYSSVYCKKKDLIQINESYLKKAALFDRHA
jgi:hypothetical protein